MGGKMTPSAVLVIKDGTTKLVNIKNQNTVNKLIDMVPDVIDKISKKKDDSKEMDNDQVIDIAFPDQES